jgi:Effector Associated Constant Component 1
MQSSATVTISPAGSIADISSLRDWLQRGDRVRSARLGINANDPEGQGGVVDTINVVLTDGAALAALTETVRHWLTSRRRHPLTVTVRSGDDSTTIVIETERS